MIYVERDGIWHIVTLADDAEAVTQCNQRITRPTYRRELAPRPVCSRCTAR